MCKSLSAKFSFPIAKVTPYSETVKGTVKLCVYSHSACYHIARSVLVGHSCLPRFARKDIFFIFAVMELARDAKITFRCTPLEKDVLSEQADRCNISTSEYCRMLALGGQPKERYSEEERQLLRDIAQLKGTLQRLNNYFGGRQYREVFEENRILIAELKKILSR